MLGFILGFPFSVERQKIFKANIILVDNSAQFIWNRHETRNCLSNDPEKISECISSLASRGCFWETNSYPMGYCLQPGLYGRISFKEYYAKATNGYATAHLKPEPASYG